MRKNYYFVLGLTSNANQEEIKSAYRQRALELHPDLHGPDSEPFLEVQEAYSVLSDPPSREAYDARLRQSRGGARPRAEAMRAPRRAESFQQSAAPTFLHDLSLTQSFETFQPSFEELFARLWGNFTSFDRPKAERLESLTVEVPLTPDEGLQGGQVRVLVPAPIHCPSCHGRGSVGPFECLRCGGHGIIVSQLPVVASYPQGLTTSYVSRIPLDSFGIQNFYLTVRFRVSDRLGSTTSTTPG